MHRLLHDIPRFFILFLEELFLIFNQMLSVGSFGRREIYSDIRENFEVSESYFQLRISFGVAFIHIRGSSGRGGAGGPDSPENHKI